MQSPTFSRAAVALFLILITAGAAALAMDEIPLPRPLRRIPVPEPVHVEQYVVDRAAAIRLGKALFWDMQVGSDGIQACGTCHFHAGADARLKNQLNPDLNGNNPFFTPPYGPNCAM